MVDTIMSFKEILKKNKCLRIMGKTFNVLRAYTSDVHSFLKYYMESAERKGDYRFSILLHVHSIEKGMCMEPARPFGFEKTQNLIKMLVSYPEEKKKEFEYQMGISILYAWKEYFDSHNWDKNNYYEKVSEFLRTRVKSEFETGRKEYDFVMNSYDSKLYPEVVLSRHSVRDFSERELSYNDIEFAVKCFIETPTACNRQMCKVIYVKNQKIKELLDKTIIGLPGFNKQAVKYFVITYDLSAFAYSGERNQGMFNAGLCTMNFVNALHYRGIGSCCLQWSNNHHEDVLVRKALNLSESERISIVIGAGYYKEHNVIPCSVRRKVDDIYTEM